jgi:hypothetical protein
VLKNNVQQKPNRKNWMHKREQTKEPLVTEKIRIENATRRTRLRKNGRHSNMKCLQCVTVCAYTQKMKGIAT